MAPTTIRALVGLPPSTPTPTDSVLIIVDAQNEYAHGILQCKDVSASRKVIHGLLEKYRAAGGAVVHIVHDMPAGAPVFTPGTELAEVFEELKPVEGEPVIHKQAVSAFQGTTLGAELEKFGKKKVVLVGYMAHNCISSTARSAGDLGYEVAVVRDAVGDRELPDATADELVRVSLVELADMLATIVESKDI